MDYRENFPIFKTYPKLTYLDNAATTQKPTEVINTLVEFYEHDNANVHRGIYPLSEHATELYEEARKKVASFINAQPEEIIFTRGTTSGLNAIATSLKFSGMLPSDPKILLTEVEHHSNILPWQRLTQDLTYLPIYSEPGKSSGVQKNFDLFAVTLASNVTGMLPDINKLIEQEHTNGSQIKYVVVDAAQAIAHIPINVKTLGADFVVFSGHKMYGPTGIGVIYAKKEILEKMEPFEVGGGMIREVKYNSSTWAVLPEKFEAGTPPIADAVALGSAVDFITTTGFSTIQKHENELRNYLYTELSKIDGISLYHPQLTSEAVGVVSFTVEGVHPHDVAQFLGDNEVCVRAGHHCTQILHRDVLQIPASLRASLAIYNTKEDIDKLVLQLGKVLKIYR